MHEFERTAIANIETFDRKSGIGASESPAVMGLSKFVTRFKLYLLKRGIIDPDPPNERMKWGTRLEPKIILGFSEDMNIPVRLNSKTYRHPSRSHQFATPDAFGGPDFEWIIEAKNVALDQAWEWGESGTGEAGVPKPHLLQANHQMDTLGRKKAWVLGFFGGNQLRCYEIALDEEVVEILHKELDIFWFDHVLANVPPPLDASRAAREYLEWRYPRNRAPLRPAKREEMPQLDEYGHIRALQKHLKTRREELEIQIKNSIGDSEGIEWADGKITWRRTRDRQDVNWRELAESQLVGYADDERAALIQQHTEVIHGIRRFLFRGDEEDE